MFEPIVIDIVNKLTTRRYLCSLPPSSDIKNPVLSRDRGPPQDGHTCPFEGSIVLHVIFVVCNCRVLEIEETVLETVLEIEEVLNTRYNFKRSLGFSIRSILILMLVVTVM